MPDQLPAEIVAINRLHAGYLRAQLSETRNVDDIELRYHYVAREVAPNL